MAIPKSFIADVAVLSNHSDRTAASAHKVAYKSLCQIYAGNDGLVVYLMANAPKFAQSALYTWFKRMGVNIDRPSAGSKTFYVQGVVDKTAQARMLEKAKKTPVLVTEVKEPRAKKPVELVGKPEDRAAKALAALIVRLKDKDPEAAAVLNDRMTAAQ